MYNVVYSNFIINLFNIDNVLLCVIYRTLTYLCTLQEYHVIYSVRYYPRFHVTVVGLGTYYPRIWGNYCIWKIKQAVSDDV